MWIRFGFWYLCEFAIVGVGFVFNSGFRCLIKLIYSLYLLVLLLVGGSWGSVVWFWWFRFGVCWAVGDLFCVGL